MSLSWNGVWGVGDSEGWWPKQSGQSSSGRPRERSLVAAKTTFFLFLLAPAVLSLGEYTERDC